VSGSRSRQTNPKPSGIVAGNPTPHSSVNNNMIGFDLFSGAGGMSLGAIASGVEVKLAVDSDLYATATYQANHPEVDVQTCDIASFNDISVTIPDGVQTVVFGGPPCQGFSTSNQRTRSKDNPKNWLFFHYLRIVKMLMPDWVVFENVKGITETAGGFFLDEVVTSLTSTGYTVSKWVLNAADFGVPQRRWRLFIVASLHGHSVDQPKPTVSKPITVQEAIGDLPILRNGAKVSSLPYRKTTPSAYASLMRGKLTACSNHLVTASNPTILERYRHIPNGGNWKDIPENLMENYADRERCHTGIYKRLRPNEPSIVIGNFRKNMLIHPSQTRGLSVREAARLQSFPDHFEFTGSIGFQQQQVGNAVPPLLAEAVFNSIRELRKA
jgi:DNA (cytosine-5)-methyltransferase 1